jgi:HD-GYP domain-containing protein (c-di-GMP phosphodiesterase class II)
MSSALTTQTNVSSGTPLLRLAERWRPAGVHLASLARDGSVLWQDPHMPRAMALCLSHNEMLTQHVRTLPDLLTPAHVMALSLIPGIQVHLTPVMRRRKVASWIAALMRTDVIVMSEELQRMASRARLDAVVVAQQVQRLPQINRVVAPAIAGLIGQMHEDLGAAGTATEELSSVTEQLTVVYEEINLLYKISSGMRFSQRPEAFLENVCREVQELGNYQSVGVALTRPEDGAVAPSVSEMMVLVGKDSGRREIAPLIRPAIDAALQSGETQVCNELSSLLRPQEVGALLHRFTCVPLIRDKRALGVLLAIDKLPDAEFNSGDLKLLNNVGNQCSIFLENAALYQDMQDLFMGVLHALTRSIDAKDAYTRGHSQRVAELSRSLAKAAGLSAEQCERVYLSGLLHDVGKIGVPETVLTKPGRLSDAEFEAIKKHPEIGAQILGNIKQLQDIIPGVLYHHERWDGRGYPYNISGEEIPLMGRIICVADSFDAMSSTRTYRPALPLDTVLNEIRRCAGSQFDPRLAELFVNLDFSPYRRAIEEQMTAVPAAAEAAK